MKSLIEQWKSYLFNDEVEEYLIRFCNATPIDKESMISEAFGIFGGTIKGEIYTYYFYNCDTLNYKYRGTKNWHKGCDCYRVDYNYMTDEKQIKKVRWNARATENRCRML